MSSKPKMAVASRTVSSKVRPVPNAAPLMCGTKLNTVRLWSDFGAMAVSDGVLASDLFGKVTVNNFR